TQTARATATGISPIGGGAHAVEASYAGDSSYKSSLSATTQLTAQPVTPSVAVTPSSSSITTTQVLTVTVTVSGASGTPTPTGSITLIGGGYSSTAATLINGSATISIPAGSLALGSDTLTASYTGDSNYNAASGTVSVTIAKATPTVTVSPSSTSITATQTLSVTVAVSNGIGTPTPSGSITLTGGSYISPAITLSTGSATINIPAGSLSMGSDTLTANYTPDASSSSTYSSTSGNTTVSVTAAVPTISFIVANQTYGNAPFTVSATSNSTGAITYSVVSGPASVTGSTVTLNSAGTVVLQASQVATGNYAAGAQNATFTVAATTPTITFTVANHTYGDAPFTVLATSNSTGAITYSVVSGPATISGATVTLTGAGTVVLQATQAAAVNYSAGTQSATFTVAKGSQTITFAAPISPVNYGVAPISLSTSASSGLAVTLSVVSGPASLSGNTLTITGAGTVVVAADQSGNANYAAATEVTRSLVVNEIAPAAGLTISPNPVLVQNAVTLTATVSSAASTPTGSVAFSDGGTALGTANLSGGIATLTVSTFAAGAHTISAVYGGDGNFSSASSATVTETVQDFTLTMGGSGSSQTVQPGGTATFTLPMTPSGGTTFPATVTFSTSALPAGFTATFNPSSLAAGSSATNVSLVLQVPLTAMHENRGQPGRGLPLVALGILMLPFAGGIRRSSKRLRRIAIVMMMLAGIGGAAALTGCGGAGSGSSSSGGAQPRTYTITVTATSGTLSHSTTATLTVQ
ncbi:MAG TPA: Ig-like domain-containing protein, partial [Acidobacteriaceae bacterium]